MSDEKQKKYYALNLTEKRIVIIVICTIFLFAVIIFGSVIIISGQMKKNELNLAVDDKSNKKSNENFSFYSDLSGVPEVTQLPDNSSNLLSSSSSSINSQASSKKEFTIELDEKNIDVVQTDKNLKDTDLVKIDNKEVLYSSSFNKGAKKESNYKEKSIKTNNYTNKTEHSLKTEQGKFEQSKRYIVQIGSYLNKDTADEISSYYQKLGYPVFVKTKSEEGKTYYRLRVGPFKEKEKANMYMSSIKDSKYGKTCYISIVYL